MSEPVWIVETRDLTRVYGEAEQIRALDGVNLKVAPGEFVAVMGPSGSGKSTLLNMIGALDLPTSGSVLVNGQDLRSIRSKDSFRAQTVGFVFQLHNLIPTLTARENVEIPLIPFVAARERRRRAEELMDLVGLSDRMQNLPGQLSGGQRQRVAVARALANNPPLVLADEPTGSLDTTAGGELMKLLRSLNDSQGTTFLVVTHDPAVARQTRRVIVMADGRIEREDHIGSPLEEDLKMWRYSGLGKRLMRRDEQTLAALNLDPAQLDAVSDLLARGDGEREKPSVQMDSKPE
jgi:ABC-type lipoprotein export system ATPase subunit